VPHAQANQILDLRPGEVFVQRNVGNLATHKDMNCMACLEYAVDSLKVKHVMVVGHYNCGMCTCSAGPARRTQGTGFRQVLVLCMLVQAGITCGQLRHH